MKKILFIIGAVLYGLTVFSLESGLCDSSCEQECQLHVTMQSMVEGRVAQMNCLQTCRQRKVWEQMVLAIDRVATQLAEQAKKGSQDNVTTTGTSMQKVNFDEAEPNIPQPDEGISSLNFGSVTRVKTTYTNTTLISPTIYNATFTNTTP